MAPPPTATNSEIFPKYILASYPRSANHWVRYVIEFLSKQPTWGEGKGSRDRKDPPIFRRFGLESYYQTAQPIAIKRHRIRDTDEHSSQMIFVIRDYREVIYRQMQKPFSIFRIIDLEKNIRKYLSLIKHYNSWHSKKLLITYEELIHSPNQSIEQIANFLGKKEQLPELIENLKEHQDRCINMYDHYTGSETKGKSTTHHSKQYGNGWKHYLDWRIQKTYNALMTEFGKK